MSRPAATVAVFVATLLPLVFLTHDRVFAGGNDASRFAQIESLVDRREPFLDGSRYRWTVDKVRLHGHLYSNKPPVLSLAGAGVYAALKGVTGWTFATHEGRVVKVLTLALVGVPFAILVALLFGTLAAFPNVPEAARWLTVAALAGGSLLTSYAGTLNNHVPAAALLFAALLQAARGNGGLAGTLAGLAACADILPGAGMAPVALLLAYEAAGRRAAVRCLAGLGAAAALFVAGNLAIVGSPLPPKLVPGAVDESAAFAAAAGGVLLPESWWYPLDCLFGAHGFLSLSPVLLFGVGGLVLAWKHGGVFPRLGSRAVALGVAAQVAGHLLLAGSYGGWSFGFRYLIPVVPILLLFAAPLLTGLRGVLFAALLVLSIPIALLGAYNPWPPAFEQEARKDPIASLVRNPVGGNAAAMAAERAPGSGLARALGERFISPDPALRTRYLRLFFSSKGDLATAERLGR